MLGFGLIIGVMDGIISIQELGQRKPQIEEQLTDLVNQYINSTAVLKDREELLLKKV